MLTLATCDARLQDARMLLHGMIFPGILAMGFVVGEYQPNARADSVVRDTVSYTSRVDTAVRLRASVLRPTRSATSGAGHPAVVIVHGSGASARDNPWTTAYAEALAARGIVVLYPDKRGSGRSGGNWRTSSVMDLAGDTQGALDVLRRLPAVDTGRIGVIGFSQGGYVASVVAADERGAAFAAVISGGTAALREQMVDEIEMEAVNRGAPLSNSDLTRLRDLYLRAFAFAKSRTGWAAFRTRVQSAQQAGGALAYATRTLPQDSSHWAFNWLRAMGNFDPLPQWLRANTRPVLFVYGSRDTQLKPGESLARLRRPNGRLPENVSTIELGGNAHALFREDVMAFLASWIHVGGKH